MSKALLAALPIETAFNICSEFIKSGGEDGKGTGIPNGFGQAQEERKTLYKWFKQASEGDIKGERPTLMKARDLLHRGGHAYTFRRHALAPRRRSTGGVRRPLLQDASSAALVAPHAPGKARARACAHESALTQICTAQATMKAGGPIAGAEVLMKYDSWASVKGSSREDAMAGYIAEVVRQCVTCERDDVLARFVASKSS